MYLLHDFVMVRALKITQLEQPYLKLMKPRDVNRVGKKLVQLVQCSFRLLFLKRTCFEFYLMVVLICYLYFMIYRRVNNACEKLWW